MKRTEARVVKRRLELILDLYDLAHEKDKESLALSEMYYRMATPAGIPTEAKPPTTSPADVTSKYNEIFSEQMEADRKAAEYRSEARKAVKFIECIPGESRVILTDVFVRGMKHKDVATAHQISSDAVRMRIDRAIMDASSEIAQECGLI